MDWVEAVLADVWCGGGGGVLGRMRVSHLFVAFVLLLLLGCNLPLQCGSCTLAGGVNNTVAIDHGYWDGVFYQIAFCCSMSMIRRWQVIRFLTISATIPPVTGFGERLAMHPRCKLYDIRYHGLGVGRCMGGAYLLYDHGLGGLLEVQFTMRYRLSCLLMVTD